MSFRSRSMEERLSHVYEGATIFYHRLLQEEKDKAKHASTERGDLHDYLFVLRVAQLAVDGWQEDGQVLNADGHPIPVPIGTREERRAGIIAEVAKWDSELLLQIFSLSMGKEDPEQIRKNSPDIFRAGSPSPADVPASSLPVASADTAEVPTDSPFPAIPEAWPLVSTGT